MNSKDANSRVKKQSTGIMGFQGTPFGIKKALQKESYIGLMVWKSQWVEPLYGWLLDTVRRLHFGRQLQITDSTLTTKIPRLGSSK